MSQKPADRQYEELKTELIICNIGGLFLAICDDENIPESVISRMQEDMPEYFHFRLQMTDEKLIFPIFFTQTFEHIGKQSDIFHVLGIEELSEKSQSEFIQSLQYGREQFKALPYSVVFWVQPEFIKKLFYAAPDFHHWVFGTYDFTGYHDDNNSSYQEKEKVFLNNIDEYLEKLIWEYEHWQEVKDSGKDFLLEVMSRANLAEYYVQMFCRDQKGDIRLLDEVLQEFLADTQQSFITMLGDFGTGKSSFSMYYFILQAKKYLSDKSSRIPLFISLKDYPKKLDTQLFIKNEFTNKFNLTFSLAVFQSLMLQGKFLFFVDGFDEMASISNEKETIQNFKELNKLAFEHLQFMTLSQKNLKNKIFMTCRTHYFFTEDQEKDVLKADYPVLYRNYVTKSQYQITRIYIQEFNEEQIKTYILKHTKNEISTNQILKIINNTYNLKELANRPLLLEMIVKTLPSLKDKQQINAADLYQAYTNEWIERDDWRSQMTPQGKRLFMWELAIKMYKKGGDFSLHYSELDEPKSECFKSKHIKNEDDYYCVYETTACSFFNRTSSGDYKFIHKSFMEYFIAECFFDCIKNDSERPIEYSKIDNEAKYFLKMIISSNKQNLVGLNLSDLILKQANLTGANLSEAIIEKADLNEANLSEAIIERADLNEANLREANFESADLNGANLREANLKRANLAYANFERANFKGANLKEAYCKKIYLNGANLRETNLEFADLNGANLREANLEKANLTYANLEKANLSEANLSEANLSEANLEKANLRKTNLTRANLRKAMLCRANLEGANLEKTNLRDANLERANLRDANFKGTNLEKVNFRAANLEKANLNGLDLKEANLEVANFREANLEGTNFEGKYIVGVSFGGANLKNANLKSTYFTESNFEGANFEGANLSSTYLRWAFFERAYLKGINLIKANLREVNFREANLEEANLMAVDIRGANLKDVNLKGANLKDANLESANLRGADLRDANLEGANLKSVIGLNQDKTVVKSTFLKRKQEQAALLYRMIPKRYGISPERLTIYLEKLNKEQLLELGEKILEWDSFESVQEWLDRT